MFIFTNTVEPLTNDHPHTTTFRVTDSGFCSYTNPSRATIPLIRPHQCDSEGCRIRGVLLYHSAQLISLIYIALTLCLPKTEISVVQRPTLACQRRRCPSLWRNVCFSHPHVTNYICSHCMMWHTVRKKKCSPLFRYEAIIVWFSQFTMTVVQN